MSTWIFLGVLALATFAVLGFYGLSISGWKAPAARTDLATPGHFVRMRGAENEIDLGRGWRSTDDPDAAWHLWWIPTTTEIVAICRVPRRWRTSNRVCVFVLYGERA